MINDNDLIDLYQQQDINDDLNDDLLIPDLYQANNKKQAEKGDQDVFNI